MFDFAKAHADSKKDTENDSLFLLLLGASGNGKSYIQGTFGLKTLYLYTTGESHGVKSASSLGGGNLVNVALDRDGDKELTPDETLARLFLILDDVESIKAAGFGAISIDGASEIENVIRNSTRFKTNVKSPFDEGPVTLGVFRQIINRLKHLQRTLNIHVCLTCILNIKEMSEIGLITDSTPQLHGYQVATGLVQQFDDVLIIGRMQKGEKVAYKLQLLASVTKTTADFKTKDIKKTFNFSPRLTGLDITSLGATLDADLSKIIALKQGKTNGK